LYELPTLVAVCPQTSSSVPKSLANPCVPTQRHCE
jgi:hypothetical protein